jgi:hypothetical protein
MQKDKNIPFTITDHKDADEEFTQFPYSVRVANLPGNIPFRRQN